MYKNKKILAVILARSGSKGIKNKNLKKINGTSLVGIAGLFAKKIKYIDLSIVSTDSIKIGKEAEKHNLKFFFKRPKSISGSKISEEKVLKHALLQAEKKTKNKYHVVISLPPTSPLRKINDVIKSIKKLVDEKYNAVWTISETDNKFHPYKALTIKNNNLNFFSNEGNKIKYRQQLNKIYYRNGGAYVFDRNSIIAEKILPNKSSFILCKSKYISIDYDKDLKKIKKIMNNKLS